MSEHPTEDLRTLVAAIAQKQDLSREELDEIRDALGTLRQVVNDPANPHSHDRRLTTAEVRLDEHGRRIEARPPDGVVAGAIRAGAGVLPELRSWGLVRTLAWGVVAVLVTLAVTGQLDETIRALRPDLTVRANDVEVHPPATGAPAEPPAP